MRTARLALALVAGLVPAALAGQGTPPLPPGLVTALLVDNQVHSAASPAYYTSEMPTEWPRALTPGGTARVAGGYVEGKTIVAVFADTARHFLADYFLQIQRAGYFEPVDTGSSGFNPHNYASQDFFCRDSVRVTARAVPGAPVGAYIRVIATRTDTPDCLPRFRIAARALTPEPARLNFPHLAPPPDLTVRNYGGNGVPGGEGISALIVGVTTTAAVLRHYIAELNAAGWTANAPVLSGPAGLATLAARDGTGAPWAGVINVYSRDSETSISINMYPERKP